MDPLAVSMFATCLLLASVFSALHLCLTDLSRSALEQLADARVASGRAGAAAARRRVAAIVADVTGHARAVAMVRILFTLALVVAAVRIVSGVRGTSGVGPVDTLLVIAGSALAVWICNVAIAESFARDLGERLVYAFSRVIRVLYLAQRPLTALSRAADRLVRAFTGSVRLNRTQEVEQELLEVVEEGERSGQIDETERRMIEAVVNFKSRTVEQIMTPRNEIEALELTSNLGAITAFVRKARHSRIPVYRDSLDDIVGFFYVKDLLRWLAGEGSRGKGGFDLRSIIRPALLVPETKTIRALAEEFVEKKIHVAIVADEYGGTAGIVSLEDIIEEVFGDIQDEYEKSEDEPPRIEVRPDEHLAEIDARAYIHDVNEALEPLGIQIPESDEYDTLGGFVLSTMGRIPAQNESFEHGQTGGDDDGGSAAAASGARAIITVLEATPTRVVRVRILVKKPEPAPDSDQAAPPVAVADGLSRADERIASK